jgi:hypothetical protein
LKASLKGLKKEIAILKKDSGVPTTPKLQDFYAIAILILMRLQIRNKKMRKYPRGRSPEAPLPPSPPRRSPLSTKTSTSAPS